MNRSSAAYTIVLAHCSYSTRGVRELVLHDVPQLTPPCSYLATGTVVQQGQALAGMIFRCDLALTDPQIPALVDRMIGTLPLLRDLLEDDPGRVMIVEPVDHRRDLPRFPDGAVCREIFLQAHLRHAAAGAA